MHKLRHFYYQNKEKIWKIILLTTFILVIIYILNAIAGSDNSQPAIAENNKAEEYFNSTTNIYISNQSAISNSSITQSETNRINTIIGKFLEYCNNGEIEQAYNMISEDCKENSYKTIQDFKEDYLEEKFQGNKSYSIKKWEETTYQVEIKTDILATGTYSNEASLVEYITIVNQDGENKLNIYNYIGKENINKENVNKNIKITAIEKDIYMDYEIYRFKIENDSNKTIKLDSMEKTGTIYLEDKNNNKYKATMHELIEDELLIDTKRTFEIEVKFINQYMSNREIERVVFEDVILDYNKYIKEGIKVSVEIVVNI